MTSVAPSSVGTASGAELLGRSRVGRDRASATSGRFAVNDLGESGLGETDGHRFFADAELGREIRGALHALSPGGLELTARDEGAAGEVVGSAFSLFGCVELAATRVERAGVAMVDDVTDVTLESVRPRGIFRARITRDGEALRRDGETFLLLNELPNRDGSSSIEIMFEDGIWMLAEREDLDTL